MQRAHFTFGKKGNRRDAEQGVRRNLQLDLFWDSSGNGFFSTTGNDPSVLLRMKEDYDGAEPSPNSVAVLNLLRLAQMLDEKPFCEMAEQTLNTFGGRLQQAPSAMPQMIVALNFHLTKAKQIVIAGRLNRSGRNWP